MPLLGRRIVPAFQWRGFIATVVLLSVLVELAWRSWPSGPLWSSARFSADWHGYVARYAPAALLVCWGLRRWQGWAPPLVAAAVAAIASELVAVVFDGLSRVAAWGVEPPRGFFTRIPRAILDRAIYLLPGAIAIRLFVRFVVVRVDEASPGQCAACGYTIGDDKRITICPECGRERGTPAKADRAARAWIALQRRGRVLATLVLVALAAWMATRIIRFALPMREYIRNFNVGRDWLDTILVGNPPMVVTDLPVDSDYWYFLAASRSDFTKPTLIYLFNPDPPPGRPFMRVMVGRISDYLIDPGTEPVLVDMDHDLALATIRAGGVPKPLAIELRRRAELLNWKPTERLTNRVEDGPSIDPRPYFAPQTDK